MSAHAAAESWLAHLAFTCFCSWPYQLFRPHWWLSEPGELVLTLNRRSDLTRGFRVALIRHFLVALNKHLHSEPAPITLHLAAGHQDWHRRNIHTIFSTSSTHNCSPGRETRKSTHTNTRARTHTQRRALISHLTSICNPAHCVNAIAFHPPSPTSPLWRPGWPPTGRTCPHHNPCTFLLLDGHSRARRSRNASLQEWWLTQRFSSGCRRQPAACWSAAIHLSTEGQEGREELKANV